MLIVKSPVKVPPALFNLVAVVVVSAATVASVVARFPDVAYPASVEVSALAASVAKLPNVLSPLMYCKLDPAGIVGSFPASNPST